MAQLEIMAGNETLTGKSSRLVATVPFGVGQFQNGDTTFALTFAISQGLAGGLAVLSSAIVSDLSATDASTRLPKLAGIEGTDTAVDKPGLESRRNSWVDVNRIAFGVWAFSTVFGVVHAHLTFVPERTSTRPRPIPRRIKPEVKPTLGILPGGGAIGLEGRF